MIHLRVRDSSNDTLQFGNLKYIFFPESKPTKAREPNLPSSIAGGRCIFAKGISAKRTPTCLVYDLI